jgi:hypothetical protein
MLSGAALKKAQKTAKWKLNQKRMLIKALKLPVDRVTIKPLDSQDDTLRIGGRGGWTIWGETVCPHNLKNYWLLYKPYQRKKSPR